MKKIKNKSRNISSDLDNTEVNSVEIGQRIKTTRMSLGLKQQDLADLTGVSKTSIQKYEAGSMPKTEHLLNISNALKQPFELILFGKIKREVLDKSLLSLIIEELESFLIEEEKELEPDKKADIIATFYDLLNSEDDKEKRKDTLKLIKLAG